MLWSIYTASQVLAHPMLLAIAAILISAFWLYTRHKSRRPLPPGPKGLPIFGNALQMEVSHPWLYHTKVAKQFGDVVHFRVFNDHIIALNSLEAIEDLIIKKSPIFSARPQLPMCTDLVGYAKDVVMINPGPRWQLYRKFFHQSVGIQATPQHHPIIEAEFRQFADSVVNGGRKFVEEFKFTVARMVVEMTYGVRPEGPENEFVQLAEEATIIFGKATQPGKFLVDSFPILKYVPSWFPGAGFKRQAAIWREGVMRGISEPFQYTKKEMAAGVSKPCFVSQTLGNLPAGADDDIVMWGFASLYSGAVDTTSAAMTNFLLEMVLHPEVQAKAQTEIDRVVGSDRLPTLADRKDLPYIDAILNEVMRIHPIAPMTFYEAAEDSIYRAWFIPKGAVMMANAWAIARDPIRFPSPEKFVPERWENSDTLNPRYFFFGFGRRICPGRHFAEAMLWFAIATILATTRLSKAKDEFGNEILPSAAFTGDTVSCPLPFPYRVESRSSPSALLLHHCVSDAA